MKTLSSMISKNDQDVDLVAVLEIRERKIRIKVRSNSYVNQCFAIAQIWDGNKWNEIATRTHGAMETPNSLCYLPKDGWRNIQHFNADYQYLINQVEIVLS